MVAQAITAKGKTMKDPRQQEMFHVERPDAAPLIAPVIAAPCTPVAPTWNPQPSKARERKVGTAARKAARKPGPVVTVTGPMVTASGHTNLAVIAAAIKGA